MRQQHQASDRRLAALLFATTLIATPPASAQQPIPSLDEILTQLENNLQHYDKQVPSFYCDEHVTSRSVSGKNQQSTITDSIFRLKRSPDPTQKKALSESREIKHVDGPSAEAGQLNGPAVLGGVFSGGLDTVSPSQKACMNYTLAPTQPEHPNAPYIIQFASLPKSQRPTAGCILSEDNTGRVFIDPATMQVQRMELIVPRHTIVPTNKIDRFTIPPVIGVWKISIDYAPVLLGQQTFWMPTTITSSATASDEETQTIWYFNAQYTNYHKLEVTSRILP